MNFFLLLNSKEDILKNILKNNQKVDLFFFPTEEINGVHQLSGYQHASKYFPLFLAEARNWFETT